MTNFWSCHLIVNRKRSDDCSHVCDFIDVDWFRRGGISTLILEWTPCTNAKFFSRHYAHFGKPLNISTANDSTSAVVSRAKIAFYYCKIGVDSDALMGAKVAT